MDITLSHNNNDRLIKIILLSIVFPYSLFNIYYKNKSFPRNIRYIIFRHNLVSLFLFSIFLIRYFSIRYFFFAFLAGYQSPPDSSGNRGYSGHSGCCHERPGHGRESVQGYRITSTASWETRPLRLQDLQPRRLMRLPLPTRAWHRGEKRMGGNAEQGSRSCPNSHSNGNISKKLRQETVV